MESRVYEKELAKEAGNETDSSSVNVATAQFEKKFRQQVIVQNFITFCGLQR
jgi:hypothetical protein